MSDILIKNMELPSHCGVCWELEPTDYDHAYYCSITGNKRGINPPRPSDCPLVALPDHGDLIDRNETIQSVLDKKLSTSRALIDSVLNVIKDAPTILEASE